MHNIGNDINYLEKEKNTSFNAVPIETIFALRSRSQYFKKVYKNGPQKDEYIRYRNLMKDLFEESLPFRIIEKIKAHIKRGEPLDIPIKEINTLKNSSCTKEEREEKLILIARGIVNRASVETLFLASKIRWLHGTNSSLLPLLPYTDQTLYPTGKLLEKGIAPLCGEITKGGLYYDGINQGSISGVAIASIQLCMYYAHSISFTFKPEQFNETELFFEKNIGLLEQLGPEDNAWDPVIVKLLQCKQWRPEKFSELCHLHEARLKAIFEKLQFNSSPHEREILAVIRSDWKELEDLSNPEKINALEEKYPSLKKILFPVWHEKCPSYWKPLEKFIDQKDHLFSGISFSQNSPSILCDLIRIIRSYDELITRMSPKNDQNKSEQKTNRLRLKKLDKQCNGDPSRENFIREFIEKPLLKRIEFNNLPFQRRLNRFYRLFFDKPVISLGQSDREFILAPFPLVLASTKLSGLAFSKEEYTIRSGTLGKEIDKIFTEEKQIPLVQSWLKTNNLANQVQVFSFSPLEKISTLPLLPGKTHILLESPLFSYSEIRALKKMISTSILPHYKKNYPNGQPRIHHGPAHAMRTLFFSELLFIMLGEEGKKLPVKPLSLYVAAGLHDVARENDGKDLWDNESGLFCQKELEAQSIPKEEAILLGNSIAHKDSKEFQGLTYDLIHDADCIEILRLLTSTEQFEHSELRIGKKVAPELLHTFIKEAFFFIKITEMASIKLALESSEDPHAFLFQLLAYLYYEKMKCPQMMQIASVLETYVGRPSDYLLPTEIVKNLNESIQH